jgi:hypothetical protein
MSWQGDLSGGTIIGGNDRAGRRLFQPWNAGRRQGQEVNLRLRLKLDSFNEKEPFMDGIKVVVPKPSLS